MPAPEENSWFGQRAISRTFQGSGGGFKTCSTEESQNVGFHTIETAVMYIFSSFF